MLQIMDKMNRGTLQWTVKELVENTKGGVAKFDNAVQRPVVWDKERSSRLIRSTILNRNIPPFYCVEEEGIYNFIDGKQRTLAAFVPFLNDEFQLEGLDPIYIKDTETGDVKEIDLNGYIFSTLPEKIKDAIAGYSVTIAFMIGLSEDDVCDVFYDLNNGKPLSPMTVTRVKSKSRKVITTMGKHELFNSALTKKALEKFANEDIIVKSWAILHQEHPSLETVKIRKLMEAVEFTENDVEQLTQCFDRMLEVHKLVEDKVVAKKILVRTHLISLMKVVWQSIELGFTSEELKNWITTFYLGKKKTTVSDAYNSACRYGSATETATAKRLNEIQKSFDKYFGIEENEEDETDDEAIERISETPFTDDLMNDIED